MSSDHMYKILIADDDAEDRLLFKEALEETQKVSLVMARDGLDLMTQLYKMVELPDVIFLDINMPRKNGHECLQEIKRDLKFDHIPVIIYSTSNSKAQIDATYNEGANLYITKPNSFTQLKKIMKGIFELKCSEYNPRPERKKFVFSC